MGTEDGPADSGDEESTTKKLDDGKKELNTAWADFMSSYVTKSMRIKPDKWQKLIGTEEYRVCIM